ncbi:hypothetical protein ACJMK2_014182 [Sinanodonta woodiana]|uniref:Uncharacterized protein n=1 Tax=Sinanodonta woodiana TaxID=1069815 RepID=A0ABD3V351_SINWO
MTSLICLVVAIGVVSGQGTSIIRHLMTEALEKNTENDHAIFDFRNEMITDLIRNQFRHFVGSGNIVFEKIASPSFNCMNVTCKLCEFGFCIVVTYQSESDDFLVEGTILGESAFSTAFNVPPWRDCTKVDVLVSVESCVTIHKVRIEDGSICADLEVEAGHLLTDKFTGLCI